MNAETRAKEIVAEFLAATTPETSSPDREWDMVKLIAQAIRQAENDKLEEAAALLVSDIDGSGHDPYEACLLRSAAMIRSLKKD